MRFKTLLISALITTAGASAFAAPTDWGTLGPNGAEARAFTTTAGTVDDIYTFSLGDYSDVASTANYYTATSLKGIKTLDLVNANLSLFSGVYGDGVTDTKVGSYNFGTAMTDYTFAGLTAGNYYFEVTGTAGTKGSDYYFNVEASSATPPLAAVPEPQNAALLLAGLGALGLLAKRRQRAKVTAH